MADFGRKSVLKQNTGENWLQRNGRSNNDNFASYKWHRNRRRSICCPFASRCSFRFLRRALSSIDTIKQQKWWSHFYISFQMRKKSLTQVRQGIRRAYDNYVSKNNKKQRGGKACLLTILSTAQSATRLERQNTNIIFSSQPFSGL